MNPSSKNNFVPVLKLPRPKWRIPRVDEGARQIQYRQEAAQRMVEGTTPQGRELLQKIINEAEEALETGTRTESQVFNALYSHMPGSQEHRHEWGLLLERRFGLKEGHLRQNPYFFAKLVVLLARVSLQRKKANASSGCGAAVVLPEKSNAARTGDLTPCCARS